MAEREPFYHGEEKCSAQLPSGDFCPHGAYFRLPEGGLVCGVHNKGKRGVALPRNPNAAKLARDKEAERVAAIEKARNANMAEGLPGAVELARMQMMKAPERRPGFIAVFPNYRAGSKRTKTTINARELSPMVIGPVEHGQPGLPPARCLENFHQAGKAFKSEVDATGNPLPAWYERRLALYGDPTPHRHKLGSSKAEHLKNAGLVSGQNANVALYSIFVGPNGSERRYTYLESRRFYAFFYARATEQEPIYGELIDFLGQGYNLQIFDPDGCFMTNDVPPEELAGAVKAEYENEARPFGHGKVLFTMLTLPREAWPWAKFF